MRKVQTETVAIQQRVGSLWHSLSQEHSCNNSVSMIPSFGCNVRDTVGMQGADHLSRAVELKVQEREEEDTAVKSLDISVDSVSDGNTNKNNASSCTGNMVCMDIILNDHNHERDKEKDKGDDKDKEKDKDEDVSDVPSDSLSATALSPPLPSHSQAHCTGSPASSAVGSEGNINNALSLLSAKHPDVEYPAYPRSSDNGECMQSEGLQRWHAWCSQRLAADARQSAEISPQVLLHYLDAVIIPLANEPLPLSQLSPYSSILETYLKPVLQLWQEQSQKRVNRHPDHGAPDMLTSSSSVADFLDMGTIVATSKERHPAVSANSQRQQDHLQRLALLEQAHRDTALTISQLQDQVRHLLKERSSSQADYRDQDRNVATQDREHNQLGWNGRRRDRNSEKSLLSSESTSKAYEVDHQSCSSPRQNGHTPGNQMEIDQCDKSAKIPGVPSENPQVLSPPRQSLAACTSQRQHDYVGKTRADELVEAIAKGLEEYHARSFRGVRPRNPQDQSRLLHSDMKLQQCFLPPLNVPTVYGSHHEQRAMLDQAVHTDSGSLDLLQPGQHGRPARNRKRTSSMNGLGSLVRDNIKQARSCSPSRPRNCSGMSLTDSSVGASGTDGADSTDLDRRHIHAQSQPPPSPKFASSLQVDEYTKPTTMTEMLDSTVSSTASSLIMFHHTSSADARAQIPRCSPPHLDQRGAHHEHSQPNARHSHTYSHASQPSRKQMHAEDYPSYRQHHPYQHRPQQHSYDQHHAYQHQGEAGDAGSKALARPTAVSDEHHFSPYFQSKTSTSATANEAYRGKHAKNYGSYSSVQSFLQYPQSHHQYQHHDSQAHQSYEHNSHRLPPLTSNYHEHQEEDVKPAHHQIHQHQNNSHHQRHPSTSSTQPPIYVMNRQVNTVPELWKEWTVGLGPGNPSIRQLEAQYGPSWRTSSSAANFFSRRLRIINEIQRMIDFEGLSEEEAVNRLEARREQGVVIPGTEGSDTNGSGGGGGMSLHRLSEILRKKQL